MKSSTYSDKSSVYSDKSYVTLEQQICPCCGKTHDTGAILMDMRVRKTFERHTVTGWSLCSECTAKNKEGYINLVVCDINKGSGVNPDQVWRTGEIIHIKREAFGRIFNCAAPKSFAWIDIDSAEKIKAMTK